MSEKNEGVNFPDGSIYHPKHVKDELKKFQEIPGNRVFPNENFGGNIEKTNEQTMDKMPVKNYVSSGFKKWFQENAENGKIKRYSSEKEIVNAVEDGHLVSIEEVNNMWRCFNVKGGHEYKEFNHPSYLALHPKAFGVLSDIAQIFQKKLLEAGIDSTKWKIRPKIESLIRDKRMANGSDLSPHEFGLGIDFAKKKAFDLMHVPDNTFMTLDKDNDELLYKAVETLFMQTLIDVNKNEGVIVTSESHPPHFHIATKK
jgi:hypothetical protein